jgi:hypothetical protein
MKNNIAVFIIVFVTILVGNSVYHQITKDPTPGKVKRLECQKKRTTFERGFDDLEIKKAQILLESGSLDFTSSVEKAVYAKSHLFEYVKLKDTDKMFQNMLDKYKTNNNKQKNGFKLSYYIYENDVKDPGKKTKKSKLYAGYVVTKLKNSKNKLIYQNQIDFMDFKGADISASIECGVKSLATFNK